jgi:arsenical pump membrane protein
MALLLDELGFFAAVAARISETRHIHLGLWVFAAAVTTTFNLDVSVVLLTPLYVRIARRHGLDPLAAAFPPVLLAGLASSALPISNLTNLLAAKRFDLHSIDFRDAPRSRVARRSCRRLCRVPWRDLPISATVLAGTLGVLAASAAPHLGVARAIGVGDLAEMRALGLSVIGANAFNNLPALLVVMPTLAAVPRERLWAVLLGVNIGPMFVVMGSLAGLLWLDTARHLGVDVDARTFTKVGLRVGGPALVAAGAALLATNAIAR